MFLRTIQGCNTTSTVFGFGNGGVLKVYDKSVEYRTAVSVFKDAIVGESALPLCKADTRERLDNLRVSKFTGKAAGSSSFVDFKELLPTSDGQGTTAYVYTVRFRNGKEEGMDPTD